MPEPAAWRYQKITKPMFDLPTPHLVLTGRILTMAGEVLENGFVELKDGKIVALGPLNDLKGDSGTGFTTWLANPWTTHALSRPSKLPETCSRACVRESPWSGTSGSTR